jgi:hypothetical protein
VHEFAPTEGAFRFDASEGRIVVWFPAPGIAAGSVIGYATGDLARRAYEVVGQQPVFPHEGFIDFYETTGFDWEARGRALKFNMLHLSPRMMLHMLVQTAPMLVATTVFRRALGDHIEVHTDRTTFASAYALAVKRRTRAVPSHPPPRGGGEP